MTNCNICVSFRLGDVPATNSSSSTSTAPCMVAKIESKVTSTIQAGRLFRAIVNHCDDLIPDVYSEVKKIDIDGDRKVAESTITVTFEGGREVKYKVINYDPKLMTYTYRLVEGVNVQKYEKIEYDLKFEEQNDGPRATKVSHIGKYYVKSSEEITEKEIKAGEEMARAVFNAVEDYLRDNPRAYEY